MRSVLFVALTLAPSANADWPAFRGPTGQGLAESANPPTLWGPDRNVTWKADIPGNGWSSPVVAGGRVYVTTAVEQGDAGQSLRAVCLDASTGKIVWDREVFRQDGATAPKIHKKNSHASPTPAVDGDRVYVHFGHMGTACLNAADGATVWANRELTYKPVHGNGGSPVVHGGKVFVLIDGPGRREMAAFDKMTGKVLWEAKRSQPAKRAFSFCTPLVTEAAGRATVVAPGSDVVNGFDPETGQELWAVTYDGYSVVPRPVAGRGLVFLSTGYDTASLLAIKVEKAGYGFAARVAWRTNKKAPRNASPLLVGAELYTVSDDGFATCFDADTGKVNWQERLPGEYTASPVFAAGRVYLQNESGVGTVLKAGPAFEVLATNDLKDRTLASYAVDGDAFLIRTAARLYRIGK